MTQKTELTRDDLWSLEQYSTERAEFRKKVMAYKKNRQIIVGDSARFCFEDLTTIKYQIQEILRVEKIFEAADIEEEIESYNPLIPDGKNLKATFMLEYGDIDERKVMLQKLKGIERQVWMQVNDLPKIVPISDEDLERENEEKTSSVHFMRFEFSDEAIAALRNGGSLTLGIDSEFLQPNVVQIEDPIKATLAADFATV
jgi:hypothetical protein